LGDIFAYYGGPHLQQPPSAWVDMRGKYGQFQGLEKECTLTMYLFVSSL